MFGGSLRADRLVARGDELRRQLSGVVVQVQEFIPGVRVDDRLALAATRKARRTNYPWSLNMGTIECIVATFGPG